VTAPWDFGEAAANNRRASQAQIEAEAFVKEAYAVAAGAEKDYRIALASKITELRAEGTAATVAGDLARGHPDVAQLRYIRDVSLGVCEAASQAVWRATADRRTVESLTNWSMRRELAEGFGASVVS